MNAPELDIAGHVYKAHHDDNDRTRVLKDVLRSSVAIQEENGGKKQPRKVALSMMQTAPRPRKDRTRRSLSSAVSMRELANCQETDTPYMSMAGMDDDSLSLMSCGSRISGLYKRLQASDSQLRTLAKEGDAQEEAAKNAEDPEEDIKIMHRPEGDDPRASRARNERNDRVVYDFIAKHARFHKLEELQENLDTSEGYAGMREFIPRKHQHHPNLHLLDSKVLTNPEKLQRAIWSTPQPATEAIQNVSSLRNRRVGPGKTMKARINLQVSTESPMRGGGALARSAPVLT